MEGFPPVTLDMMKTEGYVRGDIYYSAEVTDVLREEQYTDLGWLNAGIKLPAGVKFDRVYKNWSGSQCIYVNHEFRMFYCVDMGD